MTCYNTKNSQSECVPGVDTEKEVDWSSACRLLECLVQPLIARVSRTPDFIFERFVNIVFGVRFDDKETSLSVDISSGDYKFMQIELTKAGRISNADGL